MIITTAKLSAHPQRKKKAIFTVNKEALRFISHAYKMKSVYRENICVNYNINLFFYVLKGKGNVLICVEQQKVLRPVNSLRRFYDPITCLHISSAVGVMDLLNWCHVCEAVKLCWTQPFHLKHKKATRPISAGLKSLRLSYCIFISVECAFMYTHALGLTLDLVTTVAQRPQT